MKKILLFLILSVGIYSCQTNTNSSGTILKNDAKSENVKRHLEAYMNNDSSVAQTLFSQDLIIYDQFVNNQENNSTIPNPEGRQGLIDADKFTHVLFSEIQLTTDKISTYQMNDGKTYTAFWSMWSGEGNFSGEKMTLPFYCISLWEGNQITKIWRYMDPAGLNKEVTAFEGVNNNSQKVIGLAELKVNPGFSPANIKEFLVRFSRFIRKTEPGTYDFGYFISSDGKKVNLVEKYYTSSDFVHHLNNFEQSEYAKEFMTLFTLDKVIIAGDASDELKAKAKAYEAELRPQVGGWIN
ncbi:hypothetical protein N9M11_00465 [Flavobacteriaceae bacterium]|uniref:hypothetical protein n=1 Tax=Candidatus Arcticimaribacter forsetii TaxID=2820661 RepID=UPI00207769AE|nr:hypothetical protein [Candidatus Arcticimaribacter forsetii]MDA8698583.1 hypothetical protein [Flavobacteriaceae bacterium]MDB2329066.1 hypothetical protein [Flavobacteriaceae bacterium]